MNTGWNIRIKAKDRTSISVGNLIPYGGKLVHRYYIRPGARRRDSESWGFREALLAHCQQQGVERIYLYEKDTDTTYGISLEDVLFYAIQGKQDKYGATFNVPMDKFSRCPKVPGYVPDALVKIISSDDRLIEKEPVDAQLSFLS